MAHLRKVIRDNIKTALTGLATTGSKVYATRVYPLSNGSLPGIVMYTDAEEVEYATVSLPRTTVRTLAVKVEVYVRGVTGYDDQLDQICAEIEAALYADVTLNGVVKDTKVTAFDADFAGDAEQPVATGVLSVEVLYTAQEGSPVN